MTFIFPALLFVILLACVGFLYPEGMWSNAIRLVNVIVSGLLATNFFEPLARLFESKIHASFMFFWDYLAFWALFAVSMIVLQLLTRTISEVKVRFLKLADMIGSGAFAAVAGYVMVCIVVTSMHLAPLGRTFFFDGFDPIQSKFLGMHPDYQWLSFVNWLSRGPYATNPENQFDPTRRYVPKYAERRDLVEKHRTEQKSFRVTGSASDWSPPP